MSNLRVRRLQGESNRQESPRKNLPTTENQRGEQLIARGSDHSRRMFERASSFVLKQYSNSVTEPDRRDCRGFLDRHTELLHEVLPELRLFSVGEHGTARVHHHARECRPVRLAAHAEQHAALNPAEHFRLMQGAPPLAA